MQENYLQFFFVRCILDFPSKIDAVKHCTRTKHSLRAVSGKPNLLAPPTPRKLFRIVELGPEPSVEDRIDVERSKLQYEPVSLHRKMLFACQ